MGKKLTVNVLGLTKKIICLPAVHPAMSPAND